MTSKSSIFSYCQGALKSRKILKGLLADAFKGHRFSVNLILAAFDSGIIKRINSVDVIDEKFIVLSVKHLVRNYGLSDKNAQSAVNFWVMEYAVKYLHKSYESCSEKSIQSSGGHLSERVLKQEPNNDLKSVAESCNKDDETTVTVSEDPSDYIEYHVSVDNREETKLPSSEIMELPREEIHADGIGQVHFAGNMFRFDFMTLQPGLDGYPPIPEYKERVIMPPLGFLAAFNSMQELIDKLLEAGVLAKNNNFGPDGFDEISDDEFNFNLEGF